jgi:hypothetical protein
MQLRTAIYAGMCLIALLLFCIGTYTSFATKAPATASLWQRCYSTNCTDIAAASTPGCDDLKSMVRAGRGMCILVCIMCFSSFLSAIIEVIWPGTLLKYHNASFGIATAVVSGGAFGILIVLYVRSLCSEAGFDESLQEQNWSMGPSAPLFVGGCGVLFISVFVELCGPKDSLEYEEERRKAAKKHSLEDNRNAVVDEQRRRQEVAAHEAKKKHAIDEMLRSRSLEQSSNAAVVIPPPIAAVGAGSKVVVPPPGATRGTSPNRPFFIKPRAMTEMRQQQPVSRSGVSTPRGGGAAIMSAPGTASQVSPIRAPVQQRSPRVAQQLYFPSDVSVSSQQHQSVSYGIGDDGASWELDAPSGWYYSQQQGLFYDDRRGVFIDPDTRQTFDPRTQTWST